MIWYIVTKRHAYTISFFLKTWGRLLVERFGVATYESLLAAPTFDAPPGTYIFSDIERLSPPDAVPILRDLGYVRPRCHLGTRMQQLFPVRNASLPNDPLEVGLLG